MKPVLGESGTVETPREGVGRSEEVEEEWKGLRKWSCRLFQVEDKDGLALSRDCLWQDLCEWDLQNKEMWNFAFKMKSQIMFNISGTTISSLSS